MRNIYLNLIQNCAKHILKKQNSTNTAKFTKMKNKKIDEQNNKIKDYINTNYTVKGELTFVEQTNGVYIVNCDGDIRVKNSEIESITNRSFRFGKVSGDFSCYSCGNLKSLKGDNETFFASSKTSLAAAVFPTPGGPYIITC